MLQISYQWDKESRHLPLIRRSADRYCPRWLPGCPAFCVLQTWKPPIPVPPGSRRHLKGYIPGNPSDPFCRLRPCPLLQKFPAPGNRWTCPLREYAACRDVPEGKSRAFLTSAGLLPENILCLPERNKVPVQYAPWKVQNDPCFPSWGF